MRSLCFIVSDGRKSGKKDLKFRRNRGLLPFGNGEMIRTEYRNGGAYCYLFLSENK